MGGTPMCTLCGENRDADLFDMGSQGTVLTCWDCYQDWLERHEEVIVP
jgi:hypothetical protein